MGVRSLPVPMHGGLRQRDCTRCGGREWLPPKR